MQQRGGVRGVPAAGFHKFVHAGTTGASFHRLQVLLCLRSQRQSVLAVRLRRVHCIIASYTLSCQSKLGQRLRHPTRLTRSRAAA